MPLRRGSSSAIISENIARLRREGRRGDVAAAIAYRKAGRSRGNPGGKSMAVRTRVVRLTRQKRAKRIKYKQGWLESFGWTGDKSPAARHVALRKAVNSSSYARVSRALGLAGNVFGSSAAKTDRAWLERTYGGKGK